MKHITAFVLGFAACLPSAQAQETKVGDFRLDANAYTNANFYFDPGFELTTRQVGGAPVQVQSQVYGFGDSLTPGVIGNGNTDFDLNQFGDNITGSSRIDNLNRFASSATNETIGAAEWVIDLTPLETFLTNGQTLASLDLNINMDPGGSGADNASRVYDFYLSFDGTVGLDNVTLTPISSTSSADNYSTFFEPAQAAAVGDVVNGTHQLIIRSNGDLLQSESILALYNSGVRQINLSFMTGSFFSNRSFNFLQGTDLTFTTDVITTPEAIGDLRFIANGPLEADPIDAHIGGATLPPASTNVQVPVTFNATSQVQENNFIVPPLSQHSVNAGSVNGSTSATTSTATDVTLTAFGPDGIGASALDAFQLAAIPFPLAPETTSFPYNGQMDLEVDLNSITSLQAGARAGLMVRESEAADAAHVFLGVQQSGELLLVTRDSTGNIATQTLGAVTALPVELRITQTTDGGTGNVTFSFEANNTANVFPAVTFTTPAFGGSFLAGPAASSGSDIEDVVAAFNDLNPFRQLGDTFDVPLPSDNSDVAIRTFFGQTNIINLNRFGDRGTAPDPVRELGDSVGAFQIEVDLNPLETYLTNNSLSLSSLELRLLSDLSDANKEFDVYVSYENPAESISLTSLPKFDTSSTVSNEPFANLPEVFNDTFSFPASPEGGAMVGDIINSSFKILVSDQKESDLNPFDVIQDVTSLYDLGVREFNIIVSTNSFYSGRNFEILDGSGIFIETGSGSDTPIVANSISYNDATDEATINYDTSFDETGFEGVDVYWSTDLINWNADGFETAFGSGLNLTRPTEGDTSRYYILVQPGQTPGFGNFPPPPGS